MATGQTLGCCGQPKQTNEELFTLCSPGCAGEPAIIIEVREAKATLFPPPTPINGQTTGYVNIRLQPHDTRPMQTLSIVDMSVKSL